MDARAQQAREHHEAAARYGSEADQHRRWRDRLVRSLRSEDPGAWSYGNLAQAVGCSKTLIRQILEHEEPGLKEEDLIVFVFNTKDQPVNMGPRGVRVTHLPTGKVAISINEKSQLRNKQAALENLREQLGL